MNHFFIKLNRSQPPQPLLHPCENRYFNSRNDAELHIEEIKEEGNFFIFDYTILEAEPPQNQN